MDFGVGVESLMDQHSCLFQNLCLEIWHMDSLFMHFQYVLLVYCIRK